MPDEQSEVVIWAQQASLEIAKKEARLRGDVWVDGYSDYGFGRLFSFGVKSGQVSELHVEEERLARASPVFPIRLILRTDDTAVAVWLREQQWELARR